MRNEVRSELKTSVQHTFGGVGGQTFV